MERSQKTLPVIVFNTRPNRSSIRALLGALEDSEIANFLDVRIIESRANSSKLLDLSGTEIKGERIIFLLSFFTTQFWDAKDNILNLRKIFGNKALIICGGPHPTGAPEDTCLLGADVVVTGEGEQTIVELLKALIEGKDVSQVGGIVYKDSSGAIVKNERRKPIKLDDYKPYSGKFNKYGPVEITRGCANLCAFCQTPRIFGSKIRHRSIEKVIEAVIAMGKRGIKDFRFITPNALIYGSCDGKTPNLEAIETLLKELKRACKEDGRIFFGSFPSEVRPEMLSEEAVAILRRYVANNNLVIGAQTGSDRLLALYKRGHNTFDVTNAVKIAKKMGFLPIVDLIFGFPDETEEDVNQTLSFMSELIKLGARIHAHYFLPLVGTPLWGKRPTLSSKSVVRSVNKAISSGSLFGQWEKQIALGQQITKLFKAKTCLNA